MLQGSGVLFACLCCVLRGGGSGLFGLVLGLGSAGLGLRLGFGGMGVRCSLIGGRLLCMRRMDLNRGPGLVRRWLWWWW